VLNTRDNGYVWFEIAAIDPARDRTLAEVRDRVVKAWTEEETDRALQRKAAEFIKRIEAGESVEAVAKVAGLEAQLAPDVKRSGSQSLPPSAVARAFSIGVGAVASAANGPERVVFKVLDSATPPYDPESPLITAIAPRLRDAITEDILQQFIARTQEDIGVRINEAAVRMVVGGEQN
jgi:peptidyl-prolyl cis-trans isomerase D